MIVTGASLIEMALTQLVINIRYALMSVSLSQKLDDSVKLRSRFLIAYGNTDEIFAVASSKPGTVGEKYLYGLIFLPVLGWVGGTLAGGSGQHDTSGNDYQCFRSSFVWHVYCYCSAAGN